VVPSRPPLHQKIPATAICSRATRLEKRGKRNKKLDVGLYYTAIAATAEAKSLLHSPFVYCRIEGYHHLSGAPKNCFYCVKFIIITRLWSVCILLILQPYRYCW
jgi:hypothetical protein